MFARIPVAERVASAVSSMVALSRFLRSRKPHRLRFIVLCSRYYFVSQIYFLSFSYGLFVICTLRTQNDRCVNFETVYTHFVDFLK